jgi:predicted ester cyclase
MATAANRISSLTEAVNKKADVAQFFSKEALKTVSAAQADWRKEFPDISWKVDEVVEHGDRVGVRYTATGTHKKSGKKVSWCGSAIVRVSGDEVHLLQVAEDYLGRLISIGDGVFPASPQDNISGNWKGTVFGVPFVMDLKQAPPADKVTGTISGLGSSLPVSGTNTPPTVKLSGNTPKGAVTFTGTWAGDNVIHGHIDGAGFKNEPVTVKR